MILVTGAAGYIGSHFTRQLLRERPELSVLAVDNLSTGHRESLPLDHERLVFAEQDMGDQAAMRALFSSHAVEAVVHFAAFTLVGESEKDPGKYFANNVAKSMNLFRVMEEYGVRKIIHSSSCAVYEACDTERLNEENRLGPLSSYGESKLMIERVLHTYERCHGWSHFSLRYFNAAGAEADGSYGESHACETHLIPLVMQAASGKRDKIMIFGDDFDTADGTGVRDYVHVSDLSSAHLSALAKLLNGQGKGAVLNLGSGDGYSVKELITRAESVTGRKIPRETGPRRSGDQAKLVADPSKSKDCLGWQPKLNLDDMLRSAWLWEQSRKY